MNSRYVRWIVLGLVGVLFWTAPAAAQLKKLIPRLKDPKGAQKDREKERDEDVAPEDRPEEQPVSPLENKVRQAQEAYDEQQYEECIKLTTEVLSENPRHAVARYQRASALIDLGREAGDAKQIRAGVADAREALAVAGNQYLIFHIPYFYGLTSLAEIENRKSHAELSLSIAATLLQREDLEKDVRSMTYFQRGLAKMYLKDFRGAVTEFTSALELDPKFQAAHFARADAYIKAGDPARASQSYDVAAMALPADPLVFNNRGTFQLQQGRIGPAIADFTKALQLDGQFAMAALNRGFAHSQRLAWAEAEEDYLLSLKIDPEMTLAMRLLGSARIAQGRLSAAVDAYNKAISVDANDPENYSARGFARFFAQDYANAAADFDKTLDLSPTTTMVVPWWYEAQVRAKKSDVAKEDLQAFIKAQPKTANWHVTLGKYLLGELDDEALLATTKNTSDANAQKQWLCEARFFQGLKSQDAGNAEQAKAMFTECLKTQQTQLTAYLGAKLQLSK